MRRPLRFLVLPVLLAVTWALLAPAPAGAASPERERFHDRVSIVFAAGELCAFPARLREDARGVISRFFDQQGNLVRERVHVSFQGVFSHGTKFLSERETLNITFDFSTDTVRVVGLNWHVKLPSGRTVVIDAGRLVFDHEGDLVFKAGRHDVEDEGLGIICQFLD